MTAFHPGAAPLPSMAAKSYASHPCWKNATSGKVSFHPITRKQANDIWRDALELERRTAVRRVDAYGRVHIQGVIGRMGLLVLRALIFDFLNFKSGRLDPSYEAIARRAICSVSAVTKALRRLKEAKVLSWIPRCTASYEDGRYIRTQDTNAYAVLPSTGWPGFWKPPPAPAPHPQTWGATPCDRDRKNDPMGPADAMAVLAAARERMDRARRRPR
jgi:hypothetical protein